MPLSPITEQTVMSAVGITETDLARRQRYVGMVPGDLENLRTIAPVITEHVDELVKVFFSHLAGLDEAKVLFGYRELENRAHVLKRAHLLQMVEGKLDLAYAKARVELGLLYGRAGLPPKVFMGAFRTMLARAGELVLAQWPAEGFALWSSLQKLALVDMGIHSDVVVYERERTIGRQSEAIRELSTPVLQIRERLLLLPLIGIIDSHRAQMITENLLHAIRRTRAKVAVIDVTGVATIDSRVANHLLQTVTAARLMGAYAIVTGITADVAQSMVNIGIELAAFTTVGDLQGGVELAEERLGYRVTRVE
jgi:rsbT co-antagonist protein RsbR